MTKATAIGLAAACLIAGCATAQSPSAGDETPETPARLALDIVARHLSVEPGELELMRVEPMRWRDSAIGCPDPGMDYMHVVTPGHFAQVRDANGVVHRVHMANGAGLVCEQDPLDSEHKLQPMPTLSQRQLEALARADLAQRLGVSAEAISLVGTRSVEWPDASLGCVVDQEVKAGGASKGYVLTLAHAGSRYTYHTDLRQAIPCPPIESR